MLRIKRDRAPIGAWLDALDARAHKNVVVVAMANKLARIAWAVLSTGNEYRPVAPRSGAENAACGVEAPSRSHFPAPRRRLALYSRPKSAPERQGRKNSHNGIYSLMLRMVFKGRRVLKDRYAHLILARRDDLHLKAEYISRRLVFSTKLSLAVARRTIHS